jgi:hypothetical protein
MKAGYYLGGLTLGLIVGAGIGYLIASDPERRAKVQGFFDEVEDKVKTKFPCKKSDGLTDEEMMEIEAVLAAESLIEAEDAGKEEKTTHPKENHKK